MELPKEIRLQIYDLILVKPVPIHYFFMDTEWIITRVGQRQPQLLRTCQAIHEEAADVLYGQNRFMLFTTNLCLHLRKHTALRTFSFGDRNLARLNYLRFDKLLDQGIARPGWEIRVALELSLRTDRADEHRIFAWRMNPSPHEPRTVERYRERGSTICTWLSHFQSRRAVGHSFEAEDILDLIRVFNDAKLEKDGATDRVSPSTV